MPQTPRPWFRKQTGWWMTQVGGKQQKLAQGKENKRAAEQKFRDLLTLRDTNARTRERTADRCRR